MGTMVRQLPVFALVAVPARRRAVAGRRAGWYGAPFGRGA